MIFRAWPIADPKWRKSWPNLITSANYSQLFCLFFTLTLLGFSAKPYAQSTQAYAPARGPIVLELFTSSRCPACPKADANFDQLTNRDDILALACHVTYFDREGRRDALSHPFCDARQSIYKMALRTKKLFTPMAIVDGQEYLTGSKRDALRTALQNSAKNHTNQRIDLKISGGYLDIRLPATTMKNDRAEVWLIEYEDSSSGGYKNAVSNFTKLMNWNGQPTAMAFPVRTGYRYAVIAQDYKTGIVASGKISL